MIKDDDEKRMKTDKKDVRDNHNGDGKGNDDYNDNNR